MMKTMLLWFSLVLAIAAAGALVLSNGAAAEELDAKALFTESHKCNLCHAVSAARIEAKTRDEQMKGSDLGGKIDKEFAEIAAYVRKEGELDGKSHKKPFKGTDEELQAIIDWLGSLESAK